MKSAPEITATRGQRPEIRSVPTAGVTGKVLRKGSVAAPMAGGAAKFQDNGGAVIQIARVQLVYWGGAWVSNPPPSPTPDQITQAMTRILAGSYMTGLAQYRQ